MTKIDPNLNPNHVRLFAQERSWRAVEANKAGHHIAALVAAVEAATAWGFLEAHDGRVELALKQRDEAIAGIGKTRAAVAHLLETLS